MRGLCLFLLLLGAFPAFGNDPEHPLLPADTTSPRATLNSFMENCTAAHHMLETEGRNSENKESLAEKRDLIRNITRCLNMSEVAEFRRDIAVKESAVTLKEVLDRIDGRNNVVGKLTYISYFLHFQREHCNVVTCITFLLFKKADAIGGVFERVADTIFNVSGSGTGIDNRHLYFAGLQLRKGFLVQTAQGSKTKRDDRHHQDIADGGMSGEISDHRILPMMPMASRAI